MLFSVRQLDSESNAVAAARWNRVLGRSCGAIVLVVLLARTRTAAGAEPEPDDLMAQWFEPSHTHIELTLGYGHDLSLATKHEDGERREFAIVSPRIGLFVTPLVGDVPVRGVFEVLASADIFAQTAPDGRYLFGFGPIARYNFWTNTRVVPFVDFGIGLALHDLGHPEEGGHFGFEIQGGLGAQVLLTDGVSITGEYRFHHASNAQIYSPNFGVNTNAFTLGLSFFF